MLTLLSHPTPHFIEKILFRIIFRLVLAAALVAVPAALLSAQAAYSASSLTIVAGANGSGSQDSNLTADGKILFGDPSAGGNTVSTGALLSLSASTDIVIESSSTINFTNLGGSLTLPTGPGHTVSFSTATASGGSISFTNTGNILATSGASIVMSAGGSLTLGSLNSNGGDVTLTASTDKVGVIEAQTILTSGTGFITLQAANPTGASITQSGVAAGSAIVAHTQGNLVIDGLRAPTIDLTSTAGFIQSAGANPIQASSQLNLSAASGINVQTLAAGLVAANSSTGDIVVVQAAAPAQALSVTGASIHNNAAGGLISLTNLGSSIAVNAPISSNSGEITLAAADLSIGASVNSATAGVTLSHSTPGGLIDLGSNPPGKLGLTQADLDNISTNVLHIGSPAAGKLEVSAAVSWLKSPIALINSAALSESASGALTLNALRIESSGPVSMTNANNVGLLAASSTHAFSFSNGVNLLAVGIVDGVTGITTSSAPISLTTDAISIQKAVNAGSSSVTIQPFTSSSDIQVGGTDAPGALGLLDNELGKITAGVLRLQTRTTTGEIVVSNTINRQAGFNTLALISEAGISQTSPILVANLRIESNFTPFLTSANDVDTLAFQSTSFGEFHDVNGLTIGTVDGTVGVAMPGNMLVIAGGAIGLNQPVIVSGTVGLQAGGVITQSLTAQGRIEASGMEIVGTGPIALDNTLNNVPLIAVSVVNGGSYTNAGNISIIGITFPPLPSITGINTTNAPFSLRTIAGNITNSAGVNTGSGTVSLTAGSLSPDHLFRNLAAIQGGSILLAADRMSLTHALNAGVGSVQLRPASSGTPLNLDNTAGDPNGLLRLGQSELDLVTAGALRVGGASITATLSVISPISQTVTWNSLSLINGGSIIQTVSGKITATNLSLQAQGPVVLDQSNQVSSLSGALGGSLIFSNGANPLTIGSVDGINGLIANNTSVSLLANNLNIAQAINTGSGVLTITPLSNTNLIRLGGADANAVLGISDAELAQISAGVVRLGGASHTAGITIAGPITQHAGVPVLSLITAGPVDQTAPLQALTLRVEAGGIVALKDAGNHVNALAAHSINANIYYTDAPANSLTIGSVDGANGISTNFAATLIVGGLVIQQPLVVGDILGIEANGVVTQSASGGITTPALAVIGGNSVFLRAASNTVGILACQAAGSIDFVNAAGLEVGQVLAANISSVAGVTSAGGPINIATTAGDLKISRVVNAGAQAVWLRAGSTPASPNHILTSSSAISGAAVNLAADRMALNSAVNAGSGMAALQVVSAGWPLNLNNTAGDPNGELRLSQTELNQLSAGAVQLGDPTISGQIGINAAVSAPAGWNTLAVISKDVFSGSGSLNVPHLAFTDGSASGRTWNVSAASISVDSGSSIALSGVLSLAVKGGGGADTFNVTPSASATFRIDGGSPAPPLAGDSLHVNTAGVTGAQLQTTCSLAGCGSAWTFTNRQPLNFLNIENPLVRTIFLPLVRK